MGTTPDSNDHDFLQTIGQLLPIVAMVLFHRSVNSRIPFFLLEALFTTLVFLSCRGDSSTHVLNGI
ncbi:hypothetical protein BJY00DRAFT_289747 [Aspergillus carlsbadensis]|nr:hypothetical protein BJY00DRAFT_289747 [Aspergillus carlsbadensis]